MKRHIVLLSVLAVLLAAATVNAQTYPPELAGDRVTFGPDIVAFEVVDVIGCPYSVPTTAGHYWLAQVTVTPTSAGIDLIGFFSPGGAQLSGPPLGYQQQLPYDDAAGCYLYMDPVTFRFTALTATESGAFMRTGYFDPQPACCPWYEFESQQCLWIMEARAPEHVRSAPDSTRREAE